MAVDAELLVRPVLSESAAGPRAKLERDREAAVKTYRYLRLGMVTVVVAIFAAVLDDRARRGSIRGSISDYYYSPARAIFVAGLVSIAVSLIAIKGSTITEDTFLNLAGIAAPIVALVPTGSDLVCGSELPPDREVPAICIEVDNNIRAFLVAGAFAVLLGVISLLVDRARGRVTTGNTILQSILFALTLGLVGVGAWALQSRSIFGLHAWSAIAMFVFLGIASLAAGASLLWREHHPKEGDHVPRHATAFASLYVLIPLAMGLGGAVLWFGLDESYRVFWLETYETLLFAAMWITQSIERWGTVKG